MKGRNESSKARATAENAMPRPNSQRSRVIMRRVRRRTRDSSSGQGLVEALAPLLPNSIRQCGVLGQVFLQPRPRRRTCLARKINRQQIQNHFLWRYSFGFLQAAQRKARTMIHRKSENIRRIFLIQRAEIGHGSLLVFSPGGRPQCPSTHGQSYRASGSCATAPVA